MSFILTNKKNNSLLYPLTPPPPHVVQNGHPPRPPPFGKFYALLRRIYIGNVASPGNTCISPSVALMC